MPCDRALVCHGDEIPIVRTLAMYQCMLPTVWPAETLSGFVLGHFFHHKLEQSWCQQGNKATNQYLSRLKQHTVTCKEKVTFFNCVSSTLESCVIGFGLARRVFQWYCQCNQSRFDLPVAVPLCRIHFLKVAGHQTPIGESPLLLQVTACYHPDPEGLPRRMHDPCLCL